MKKFFKRATGVTLIEVIFAVGMIALLTGSLFQVIRMINRNFVHSKNKLDILQTTRIIMAGIRNELRNASKKPETLPTTDGVKLRIPLSDTRTVVYIFNNTTRRLFRGVKGNMYEGDLAESDMRPFLFDDGQILAFEFDSSYRDSNSFVQSELALNSKVWFKVTMKILYTEKMNKLSEAEKQKILADPDADPRVKSFFMMITPRKVNWLLQATQ